MKFNMAHLSNNIIEVERYSNIQASEAYISNL